ncbi:hypothetical protein [Acinetobacter sp. YH12219]|uniref:hypothetical protein n=1 Tax=Acinetobacter sp. YH12219 TaxID=2601153 RepID=UPI0015D453C0|nr:hypothetical protein [Acinetobacter sp. YH12219]
MTANQLQLYIQLALSIFVLVIAIPFILPKTRNKLGTLRKNRHNRTSFWQNIADGLELIFTPIVLIIKIIIGFFH